MSLIFILSMVFLTSCVSCFTQTQWSLVYIEICHNIISLYARVYTRGYLSFHLRCDLRELRADKISFKKDTRWINEKSFRKIKIGNDPVKNHNIWIDLNSKCNPEIIPE